MAPNALIILQARMSSARLHRRSKRARRGAMNAHPAPGPRVVRGEPMSERPSARPTFVLRLRPGPRIDGVRAMRGLLKAALRRFGLKCLEAREELAATAASRPDQRRRSGRAQWRRKGEPNMDMREY